VEAGQSTSRCACTTPSTPSTQRAAQRTPVQAPLPRFSAVHGWSGPSGEFVRREIDRASTARVPGSPFGSRSSPLECVLREFVEHYRRSGHTRDWGGGCRVESPPAPVPAGRIARRDRPGGLGSTNTNERHHDPTPVFLTPHLRRPPFSCPGWPSPWVPRPAQRSPTGIALTTKVFSCKSGWVRQRFSAAHLGICD